ncbi:MAG: S8 family serine peptidase [Rhodanobacteraceae bacterium]|nr:S8 family serine peptidase [Rhodanobacteraceae bacterium]
MIKFNGLLSGVAAAAWLSLAAPMPAHAAAAAAATSAASTHTARIDPSVLGALSAAPAARTTVLIKLSQQADLTSAARIEDWNARGWAVYNALRGTAQNTQAELMTQLRSAEAAGNASKIESFWIVNVISVETDLVTVESLAASPQVAAILPALKLDPPVLIPAAPVAAPNAIEWGVSKIRAPEVWSTYATSGAGVVIANVDTGVQYNHPALVGQYRGNLGGGNFNHNYNWFDPTGASAVPVDGNGHGTHTMGTEVGTDGGSNQIGVAPGARWIAAFGCCPSNQALLSAQQFMLAPTDLAGNNPNPALRPHVLNQSWGGPGGSEIFEDVIAALRASGIFPAFSAGNNGSSAADGCGRMGSPGDNPSAFSVGATDINDAIGSFSSRGPNPFTGRIGPEVSAPGVSVRSSVPTNGYSSFNGTSMASPHVAGAVALLIAVEPQLAGQIDQIEELLRKTAAPLTSAQTCGGVAGSQVPNNVFGWGRLDVKAAADFIFHSGNLQGSVSVDGTPTGGVVVSFTRLGKTLTTTTDSKGDYRVLAGAGSYAMSASYRGQTVNAAAVVVAQNATTQQDFAIGAIATYRVSGTVTQPGVVPTPVPAMLMIAGQDTLAPVWADASGAYSIDVPSGTYNLLAIHPGYQTVTQSVSAGGTVNIQMTPRSNYQCLDNTQPGGPTYVWTDATAGTAFPLDDDASSSAITLPGTFTYFGSDFTTVRINSNGFLYFGTPTFSTAHMLLPFEGNPNNDVMALGEDLNPALGAQGNIYAQTVGNRLVVQYHQVQHWANGFPETFQIILDTDSDQITYQYHTLSWPDFTSVGVENANGSVGQMYSYRNSANLVGGRAVQFTPAVGVGVNWGCDHAYSLTIADDADPVSLGDTITYRMDWNLTGFGGARGTTLSVPLPAKTSFVDAAGGIEPVADILTFALGDQRPGAQGSLWFRVTADTPVLINASATIGDSDGETRNASQTTLVRLPSPIVFQNGFEGL